MDLELLTAPEAARILKMTVGALANQRCLGGGPPFVRVGGRVRYPVDLLRQYLNERLINPAGRRAS